MGTSPHTFKAAHTRLEAPTRRRRPPILIIRSILRAATEPRLKTRITVETLIGPNTVNRYLAHLEALGYVERRGRLWRTTDSGARALAYIDEVVAEADVVAVKLSEADKLLKLTGRRLG